MKIRFKTLLKLHCNLSGNLWGDYMFIKSVNLLSVALLTCACLKQQESITPLSKVETIAEIQKEALMNLAERAGNSELSADANSSLELSSDPSVYYLNIKYNIKNIDVFEAANMPNTFEQIGHSFLQTAAKALLAIAGPRQFSVNDISLNIPDLNIDRTIIKSIQIKRIFLQYNAELDQAYDYAANFSFINTLELARSTTVAGVGKVDSLFLGYSKARNKCMFKCIQFDILENNIIDMLKPNTFILLKPSLSVSSLPTINELKLDGVIELKIGLKLPF